MTKLLLALSLAAASAIPAFAQDAPAAAAMVCSEYETLDNAGKNAVVAELQSEAEGMGLRKDITADQIFTNLAAGCVGSPEILIVEVVKAAK